MRIVHYAKSLAPATRVTVLMIFAMTFFSSMGVFIRLAAEQLHPMTIVFFRNSLALLLMVPWLLRYGIGAMGTRRVGLYGLRAAINVIGMAAGFTAITLIPLADATALNFTSPLWATLGAIVILGEVVRVRRIIAIVVGMVGVLIVLRPGVVEVSLGSMLMLTNALLLAMTALIVKKLTDTERPAAIVTWMVLLQSPLSLVPALFYWQWPSPMTWIWLWCLAAAGTLGHICWTRSCALAEITALQPLEFIKLPVSALLALLIFAERPTVWTWAGGAVIFASTAYITHREARMARLKASTPRS